MTPLSNMKIADKKFIACSILMALLGGCGGNSTSSGIGGSRGPTPHDGEWQLVATVAVTVGETAGDFVHTSNVMIDPDGSVVVASTDSDCAITARASGSVLTYEERCSFGSGCVVTFATQAGIVGTNLSAPFGPERFVCSGEATSYSGNLIGFKCDPTCSPTPTPTSSPSPTPTPSPSPTPTPSP